MRPASTAAAPGARLRRLATVLVVAAAALVPAAVVRGDEPVVRAVLCSSALCPHCKVVREETLPPLAATYGQRLKVLVLDTTTPVGRTLCGAAYERFGIQRRVVPMLVLGDAVLMGSEEIPRRLPGLVEEKLAGGGAAWPDIPGLAETLAAESGPAGLAPPPPTVPPLIARPPDAPPPTAPPRVVAASGPSIVELGGGAPAGPLQRFARDPAGNGLAVVVLVAMVGAVATAVARFGRLRPPAGRASLLVPLLALAGLGVAAYLAHVEVSEVEAVCGPVGDCNAVQQSEHARLFGLLPIGVLGVVGYLAILGAWVLHLRAQPRLSALAGQALAAMGAFGVLFSAYLTFLEPFVIGATCLWCLTSAVIMTVLFPVTLPMARRRPGASGAAEASRPEES